MWVKTPCRILIGRGDIPMSTELSDALAVDEATIDFRSFAADPTQLPDVIEGEAEEEQEDVALVESKPAVETKPEPVQKANTKPRDDVKYTNTQDAAPATANATKAEPEQAADKPAQGSLLDDAPSEPDWSQNEFGKQFLSEVSDLGFDGAADLYDVQLAQTKDEKPGLFSYLMAESAKITNA